MKIGVMAAGLGAMGFEKALAYCQRLELGAIELPVGGYPGKPFFDPEEVLKSLLGYSDEKIAALRKEQEENLEVMKQHARKVLA